MIGISMPTRSVYDAWNALRAVLGLWSDWRSQVAKETAMQMYYACRSTTISLGRAWDQ